LVTSQKLLRGGHLQIQLRQGDTELRAIAWRWTGEANLPAVVDVAYRLRLDSWQGKERLQLELQAVRGSALGADGNGVVVLQRRNRRYWCHRQGTMLVIRNSDGVEIRRPAPHGSGAPLPTSANPDPRQPSSANPVSSTPGSDVAVSSGQASCGPESPSESPSDDQTTMDHPYVRALIQEAAMALGLAA
jgi:hypothetical protein